MSDLSVTQELVILLLNEGNKLIPAMSYDTPVSLVVSGLLELVEAGYVQMPTIKQKVWDKSSRLEILKDTADAPTYLLPLVEAIRSTKNQTLEEFIQKLFLNFSNDPLESYTNAIVATLAERGLAESVERKGFFRKEVVWETDARAAESIIQNLRANLLEEGHPERESVMLSILLQGAELFKRYFSEHEQKQIKDRIESFKSDPANLVFKEVYDSITLYIAVIVAVLA